MTKKVLVNLDLNQNEIQNGVIQNLASAPSSPKKGQKYFNTTSNVGFSWNGTAWRPYDAAALTDGSISNSALTTNPLARANHTGTQLAATISDLATTVQGYALNLFASPLANINMNSFNFTNLLDPTSAQQAATKNYVDSNIQAAAAGISSKPPVRTVFTTNIALTGLQNNDGVTAVAGDRALLTGQTTASQNGVYVQATGAWSRATDQGASGEIEEGALWLVTEGTAYGKTQWMCNTTGAITVGTTSISIVQFGAGLVYSGDGTTITLAGSTFSVKIDGAGWLTSSGSGLAVDKTKVPGKYATTLTGDNSTVSYTVTHNLGTTDVIVRVQDTSGNEVLVDTQAATTNTVVVTMSTYLGTGTNLRCIVHG